MTPDPLVSDYLDQPSRVTVGLDPAARAELLQEVRQHISDAHAAGLGASVGAAISKSRRSSCAPSALPSGSAAIFARRCPSGGVVSTDAGSSVLIAVAGLIASPDPSCRRAPVAPGGSLRYVVI
jgi:hypothetical protein